MAQETTAAIDHPGWVQAPGMLIRPDCVHEIPNGAKVEMVDDQITGDVTLNGALVAHYDPCPEDGVLTRPRGRTKALAHAPGTGNGWVEASQWETPIGSGDNIDYLGGSWTVPTYPAANGALIYLFNGIEPSAFNWILQPVLQYGSNGSFGGNYWVIASWLVGPNNFVFHSQPQIVHPGNVIYGYTELYGTSAGNQEWQVVAEDTSTGVASWFTHTTSTSLHWNWAFAAVLEAYNVTSCSEFPASGDAAFTLPAAYPSPAHGFPSYLGISPQGWFGAVYPYGGPACGFNVFSGKTSTLVF
jgi:hypothetical protein